MNEILKKGFLSGSAIKWIAILTMLMDHAAKLLYIPKNLFAFLPNHLAPLFTLLEPIYSLFLLLGRLSFPLFCFLLVEGFIHTSNQKKYLLRLSLFAIISEIPYDLAFSNYLFNFQKQNVFFTLAIGCATLMGLERVKEKNHSNVLLPIGVGLLGILAAEALRTDYGGWIGILLIIVFYIFREQPIFKYLLATFIILQNSLFGLFSLPIIYLYNGKKGRQWKYFFYWFYPIHLLLLFGAHYYLFGIYFSKFLNSVP